MAWKNASLHIKVWYHSLHHCHYLDLYTSPPSLRHKSSVQSVNELILHIESVESVTACT